MNNVYWTNTAIQHYNIHISRSRSMFKWMHSSAFWPALLLNIHCFIADIDRLKASLRQTSVCSCGHFNFWNLLSTGTFIMSSNHFTHSLHCIANSIVMPYSVDLQAFSDFIIKCIPRKMLIILLISSC